MNDERIAAFWQVARSRARLAGMPGYFGPTTLEAVQPPAWSFGNTEEAKALLADLLDNEGSTSTVPLAEFEAAREALPEVGTLGIVLDEEDDPQALVATAEVRVDGDDVIEVLKVLYRQGD